MAIRKLKVCVIDDEKVIRESLVETLNESLELSVVGQGASVAEAVECITQNKPDAVFLDIKLREGDAFQVIDIIKRQLSTLPAIVLNTGYNEFEYAQRTFNEYKDVVVQILQKPFWEDWDKKEKSIVDSIYKYLKNRDHSSDFTHEKIKIKADYKSYQIYYQDLQFVEVLPGSKGGSKLILCTEFKNFTITKALKEIAEVLPDNFIQINRYTIINGRLISHYDHSDHVLFLKGFDRNFAVGDAYNDGLLKWMDG